MKFDKLIQEIWLDNNLYNADTQKPMGIGASRMIKNHGLIYGQPYEGKKIAELKGYDIYARISDNPHDRGPAGSTVISAWKDDTNYMIVDLKAYGEPNTYKEVLIMSFEGNTLYASDLYHFIIVNLGFKIVSDAHQSQKGAAVWRRLLQYTDIDFSFFDPHSRKHVHLDPSDTKQVEKLWTTDKNHEAARITIKAQKK
jgi:hypothetical protein